MAIQGVSRIDFQGLVQNLVKVKVDVGVRVRVWNNIRVLVVSMD